MKPSELTSTFLDKATAWLPDVTRLLWLPGLLVTAYAAVCWVFHGSASAVSSSLPGVLLQGVIDLSSLEGDDLPFSWLGQNETALLVFAMTAIGFVYFLRTRRGDRTLGWLSLATWSLWLTFLNILLSESSMPLSNGAHWGSAGLDGPSAYSGLILEGLKTFVGGFLNLRLAIVMTLFAVLLEMHRRAADDEETETMPIGGVWNAMPALALSVVTTVLLSSLPPFGLLNVLADRGSEQSWVLEYWWKGLFAVGGVLDLLLLWFAGMLVYAWKTGARLSVTGDRIRVSLAGARIGLLSVAWKRVLSVREVVTAGRTEIVDVVAGVLPWFRFTFSVNRRRDGEGPLHALLSGGQSHGLGIQTVHLRRGLAWAGWSFVLLAFSVSGLMQVASSASMVEIARGDISDIDKVFAHAQNFTLLAALTTVAALCLGLGLGFLFAKTYASIRPVPFVGTLVAAVMMPTPTITWLAYIAIYAILMARLSPVEKLPWIPFPDAAVTGPALWLVGAQALFAGVGFILAHFIAVRPWHSAFPLLPYRRSSSIARPAEPEAIGKRLTSALP